MAKRLIIGYGAIGRGVAEGFRARGDDVTIVTRSGAGGDFGNAVALDAYDASALSRASEGHDTIVVASNPPYWTWPVEWPRTVKAVVEAAAHSGADVVQMGNLYSYGPPTAPMSESTAENATESKGVARREAWALLRAGARERGFRAVEVRASDYFGPGAGPTAHAGDRLFTPLLAGRPARVIGSLDARHSWNYLPDIAAAIVAAATHDGAWDRVWHVPSARDASWREFAADISEQIGAPTRVSPTSTGMLRMLGVFSPLMKEVAASSYQFTSDFLIDARESAQTLGIAATPWPEALAATVRSYRS